MLSSCVSNSLCKVDSGGNCLNQDYRMLRIGTILKIWEILIQTDYFAKALEIGSDAVEELFEELTSS